MPVRAAFVAAIIGLRGRPEPAHAEGYRYTAQYLRLSWTTGEAKSLLTTIVGDMLRGKDFSWMSKPHPSEGRERTQCRNG